MIELVWCFPFFPYFCISHARKLQGLFSTPQTFFRDFQVISREANTASLRYASAKINCTVSLLKDRIQLFPSHLHSQSSQRFQPSGNIYLGIHNRHKYLVLGSPVFSNFAFANLSWLSTCHQQRQPPSFSTRSQ